MAAACESMLSVDEILNSLLSYSFLTLTAADMDFNHTLEKGPELTSSSPRLAYRNAAPEDVVAGGYHSHAFMTLALQVSLVLLNHFFHKTLYLCMRLAAQ